MTNQNQQAGIQGTGLSVDEGTTSVVLPRTAEQILERIEKRKPLDIFGFEWPYLLDVLTFEQARPYLKAEATPADWNVKSLAQIREEAINYMPFAWEKANGCRGLSAGRSIAHYQAWLWLLGVDWVDELENYQYYGKDELVRICNFLGLDSSKWDDGIRSNGEY